MSKLMEQLQQSVALVGAVGQVPPDVSYALSREAQAATFLLSSLEEIIGDDEAAKTGTIEGETNVTELMQAAVNRMAYCKELLAGIEARQKSLKDRYARIEAQEKRIRETLLRAMETLDLAKYECAQAMISMRNTPVKAVITNEADLPSAYLKETTTIKPDLRAVLDALKSGATVKGAVLSNGGKSLAVKFS